MVKEILNKNIDGIHFVLTVPDSASRADEIEEFIYWIKYYKGQADRLKKVREKLLHIADEDEDIAWLMHETEFSKMLDSRVEFYKSIAMTLLKELVDYVTADELIHFAPLLFSTGLGRVIEGLIRKVSEVVEDEDEEDKTADKSNTIS